MTTIISADGIEGQLLEHEHRRLRVGLGNLQDTIAESHRLTRSATADRVVRTLAWLRRDVLPHAAWEEAWLYPHLDRSAGTAWATRALRFEHEQIREVAAALESVFQALHEHWTIELSYSLVVALTRLEALIAAHLAQEERFVQPLLDLTDHSAVTRTN